MQNEPYKQDHRKRGTELTQDGCGCSSTSPNASFQHGDSCPLQSHEDESTAEMEEAEFSTYKLKTTIVIGGPGHRQGDWIELEADRDNQRKAQTLLLDTGSPITCITKAKVYDHGLEEYVKWVAPQSVFDNTDQNKSSILQHGTVLQSSPLRRSVLRDFGGHEIPQVGTITFRFQVEGDTSWKTIMVIVVETAWMHDIDWVMGRDQGRIFHSLIRCQADKYIGMIDYERSGHKIINRMREKITPIFQHIKWRKSLIKCVSALYEKDLVKTIARQLETIWYTNTLWAWWNRGATWVGW